MSKRNAGKVSETETSETETETETEPETSEGETETEAAAEAAAATAKPNKVQSVNYAALRSFLASFLTTTAIVRDAGDDATEADNAAVRAKYAQEMLDAYLGGDPEHGDGDNAGSTIYKACSPIAARNLREIMREIGRGRIRKHGGSGNTEYATQLRTLVDVAGMTEAEAAEKLEAKGVKPGKPPVYVVSWDDKPQAKGAAATEA